MAWYQEYKLANGQIGRTVYERMPGNPIPVSENAGHYIEDARRIKNKLEKQKMDAKRTGANFRATLWDYCDKYATLPKKKRSRNTLRIIELSFRRVKEFFTKNPFIVDLTSDNCDDFLKWLYEVKKYSHTTAHMIMRNFRAVLNLALRKRIIEENPSIETIHMMGEPENRVIFINAQEKAKLYASAMKINLSKPNANIELVNMIKIMLNTGLRRAEVLNLAKEHMLDERRIVVPSRRMKRQSHLNPTKAREPFSLHLNSEIYPIFAAVKEGKIFKGWTEGTLAWRFRKAAEDAGLGELTPHGLRHTFASDALAKGVPIDVVQEMLNHSSIELTKKFYAHLEKGRLEESYELLASKTPQLAVA